MSDSSGQTMTTKWICEKCDNRGEVTHDLHEGFFFVYNEIKDQHYQLNRFCEWDVNCVRVFPIRYNSSSTTIKGEAK